MNVMLAIRDALGRFYGKHDTMIRIFLKFAAAFLTFMAIRAALGQTAAASHPLVLLALAAVCALLPSNAVIIVGTGLILVHFYGISLEAAIVGGGVLLVALLLYFSMAPNSAWPLALTMFSMGLGVGCVPALIFGLIGGPLSALGVAFGVLIYYLMRIVSLNGGNLQATSTEAAEAMLQRMASLIEAIISDREMLVMMTVLAATLMVVYFVRSFAVKYAWVIASAAGVATYLALRICAFLMLDMDLDVISLAIELAAALLAAWIAQTMLFSLDYKKTENVRFEDDEYYYYVKAVPKKKIRRRSRRRRAERR